jgi:hypothetical protein
MRNHLLTAVILLGLYAFAVMTSILPPPAAYVSAVLQSGYASVVSHTEASR